MLIKEEFEDSKGVIRSCKLKKDSKHPKGLTRISSKPKGLTRISSKPKGLTRISKIF
jgi:hypothetical protein